jgi:anti-sigma B factor antagonist
MPAPLALIEDGPRGDVRIVSVRGEIDVGTTPSLRDWLARASERGTRGVGVDLDRVDFIAVSGVYVLCEEAARLARNRARLTVVCSRERTLRLFEVCRLGDVLPVVPDRAGVPPAVAWEPEDAGRAGRLGAWLERYAAGASSTA